MKPVIQTYYVDHQSAESVYIHTAVIDGKELRITHVETAKAQGLPQLPSWVREHRMQDQMLAFIRQQLYPKDSA